MSENYRLKVNDHHEFKFEEKELDSLDITNISDNNFHLIENNQSIEIEFLASDFNHKKYQVKVKNKIFTVSINNKLDLLIDDMGFDIGVGKQINSVIAPMPGLILEVNVDIGNEVEEDEPILILEAMKMENVLVSPKNGIIKSISVKKGETVDKNDLLVEFE